MWNCLSLRRSAASVREPRPIEDGTMTTPRRSIMTAVLVLPIAATYSLAETNHVPAEYPTIQAAIDAAASGDEVVLASGIYTENFTFKEDHVLVRSAEGPSQTIIDGGSSGGYACVYFPPYSSGELRGVTVRNHEHPYTGAVTIKRCVATVANCTFEDNRNYFTGSAVRIDSVSLGDTFEVEVVGCTFRRNESSDWGGALSASLWEEDDLRIADCLFEDNTSGAGGHMLLSPNGPDCHVVVEQCTFRNGSGDEIAGMRIVNEGIMAEGFNDVDLLGCTFEDHEGVGIHVQGKVHLTLDGGVFRNTGAPAVALVWPSTAGLADTSFCGSGSADISGSWTDLGNNSFDSDCECLGDGMPDGIVDIHDLLAMIAAFGTDDAAWDFNDDGLVGVDDMLILIAAWGPC